MNNISPVIIEIKDLTKIYKLYDSPLDRLKEALHWGNKKYHRDFHALSNINFEIKKGETIGIIGKNGSGKSTLLKIITGVLSSSIGNVKINGRISALLELGAGFNPEYTGVENIYFQGNLLGYSRNAIGVKLKNILDFADIGDFAYQQVKMYSSGMFARLAFAVAINVDPDILIVDEALSVGDIAFQNKCMRKMEDLLKIGVTVLLVSHDTQAINKFCKRVLWLHDGCLREYGDPSVVLQNYISFMHYGLETSRNTENKSNKNFDEFNDIGYEQEAISSDLPLVYDYKLLNVSNLDSFGLKKALINKVGFINEDGIPTSILEQGEYAVFICEFSTEIDLYEVGVGILFKDKLNNDIFTINSYMYGVPIRFVAAHSKMVTRVKFRVPKVFPKEYIVTVALSEGTQMNHVQQHWIHSALTININSKDYIDECIFTLPRNDVSYNYEQI